jgi:tetrapyrrole methylase family protein/MazG family protein
MTLREEINSLRSKERYTIDDLRAITRILRSEEGCPWDREQDHHSIRTCLIEETYEVVEAIDTEDPTLLREELGDVLFQVIFHAELERERGSFSLDEVIHDISAKMVHRHPHVFGEISVASSAEVLQNWESIKTEEKQRNTLDEKLRAIPPMMPALMRASKVVKKAGLTADTDAERLLCVLSEQLEALRARSEEQDAHEQIGELLLNVTTLARSMGVDSEHALSDATNRLIDRVAAEQIE